MGFFDRFKNKSETINETNQSQQTTQTIPTNNTMPLLNLEKGQLLDLTKYSTTLSKIRAAAGWDVNDSGGSDYDLDLCAYLVNKNGEIFHTVYYGDKSHKGIYLDGDNLTGEGEGDDENIHVTLDKLPDKTQKVIFAVVIYQAKSRGQKFKNVKNAYVRLIDENNGEDEICRYMLTEDGENNTAVTFAELDKSSGNWTFKAIGEYSKDSIESLGRKLSK
jgi:tellurium resistance protein TerD